MATIHSLGFPRIGPLRGMKWAVESYWDKKINENELIAKGKEIRRDNWAMQAQAGLNFLPVGDFSWYDHVLDMSALLGVIPSRMQATDQQVSTETYFLMARGGRAANGKEIRACEMTKWFDTNYHYIVPELHANQVFALSSTKLFDEIAEAEAQGYQVKPVLLGPLSYLWLGKTYPLHFDKLNLLPDLIAVYQKILAKLRSQHISWVQMDEPILVLDLLLAWRRAFQEVYQALHNHGPHILLTTYFGGLEDNLETACALPVSGLHIDAVRAPKQIRPVLNHLRKDSVLSIGIIDGRNVWKTDLQHALKILKPLQQQLQDRLWIAGSCSFLHSPVDLDLETALNPELKQWLAFAKQKTEEIAILGKALNEGEHTIAAFLDANQQAIQAKQHSTHIHNPLVKKRCQNIDTLKIERSPYPERHRLQKNIFHLPLLPTTTIGSFPQTDTIRQLRRELKAGSISLADYENHIREQIRYSIEKQLQLGLDVLVHGEPERNDMVEYFGEQLNGFAFTQNGWVQGYGSRCVKPPIIYGDVSCAKALTTAWSQYAQSLTKKPMKGMLTGPITMVMWSFVRNDQPRYVTAQQIALVLRDEVQALEKVGIKVIQIDEPAFREGLPLRHAEWEAYLREAVKCFKLVSGGAQDGTQIHTHMCYSEFNDIIEAIAEMDADVVSIETSRSNMELLEAFKQFSYPNEIGPGVYDIHSPRIPTVEEIVQLIEKAAVYIPPERLWINPDCGLKTRKWPEVEAALANMIEATRLLREKYAGNARR